MITCDCSSLWSDIYILGDLRAETNGGNGECWKNGMLQGNDDDNSGGTNNSTTNDNANSNSEQ